MQKLVLAIGNRNYSSWSLRPWILMRHVGLSFEVRLFQLETPGFKTGVREFGPAAAGRVPMLHTGSFVIWDSLSICEYACEISGRGLPRDPMARAVARSVSAEMHSSFQALRSQWPMNIRADRRLTPMTDALRADIARIDAIWTRCREQFGTAAREPWLFGAYSIADAFFAPVVMRFRTYGGRQHLSPPAAAYFDHVLADPILEEWVVEARKEPWVVSEDEAGTPA